MQGPGGLDFAHCTSTLALASGRTGSVRVALNPASSMGLMQVIGGVLEQIGDCFSTANKSTGNPAFPVP